MDGLVPTKNERERERAYRIRNGVALACHWKGNWEALADSSNRPPFYCAAICLGKMRDGNTFDRGVFFFPGVLRFWQNPRKGLKRKDVRLCSFFLIQYGLVWEYENRGS